MFLRLTTPLLIWVILLGMKATPKSLTPEVIWYRDLPNQQLVWLTLKKEGNWQQRLQVSGSINGIHFEKEVAKSETGAARLNLKFLFPKGNLKEGQKTSVQLFKREPVLVVVKKINLKTN
jgi:hypothetical protein